MRRGGTAGGLGGGFRLPGPFRRRPAGRDRGEVIFEFYPVGRYVKVSAMHAATLTEVCVVGDPRRGEAELKALALSKLRYVLAKNRQR